MFTVDFGCQILLLYVLSTPTFPCQLSPGLVTWRSLANGAKNLSYTCTPIYLIYVHMSRTTQLLATISKLTAIYYNKHLLLVFDTSKFLLARDYQELLLSLGELILELVLFVYIDTGDIKCLSCFCIFGV